MAAPEQFVVPSKKLVRRAGDVLAGRSDSMPLHDAMDILSCWRSLHTYPINTLQAYLRGVLKRNKFTGHIVAQRLKRTPSIVQKLSRFPGMALDRMQDIGGLRVIVSSVADVKRLHNLIISSKRIKHQLELPAHDYIAVPKSDGYRSLHQVLKFQNFAHGELNGLRLEIQIRTKLQHSWATAVETLGMIQKSSIKTGGGDEVTKRFFKIISALFAIDEGCPVAPDLVGIGYEKLVEELKDIEDKTNILSQLEGVAVSAKHIEIITKDYTGYRVIQLFIAEKRVRLTEFEQPQDAESFYRSKETETREDPNVAVVLMSAGALKDVRKAYPNYFLDTRSFIQNVRRIAYGK